MLYFISRKNSISPILKNIQHVEIGRARARRPLQTRQTKIQPWKSEINRNYAEYMQGCQAENKKTSKASLCSLILYVVIFLEKKFNFSNS